MTEGNELDGSANRVTQVEPLSEEIARQLYSEADDDVEGTRVLMNAQVEPEKIDRAPQLSPDLDEDFRGLPGEDLVRKGLEDFFAGRKSVESWLVQIGRPRLTDLGVPLPEVVDGDADYRLYDLMEELHGAEAHSKYNSWIRQLVSFERALSRRRTARRSRK